jgi:hypothetical protein
MKGFRRIVLSAAILPVLALGDSNVRRRRLKQTTPCILVQRDRQYLEKSKEETLWTCELQGEDAKNAKCRFVTLEGLDETNLKGVTSGMATLLAEDGELEEGTSKLYLGINNRVEKVEDNVGRDDAASDIEEDDASLEEEEADVYHSDSEEDDESFEDEEDSDSEEDDVSLEDEEANVFDNQRALANVQNKVLVVRVQANDKTTSFSEAQLSDSIFGTNGDQVNLKERFASCSYDELTMEPYSGTTSTGVTLPSTGNRVGVVTVTINSNVKKVDVDTVEDRVVAAAEDMLGDLQSQFDHVMLCIPPGTQGGWIGYAYINSWLSVYNDDWCTYPSIQMHEIGHNLGLGHAGFRGNTYDDETGTYSWASPAAWDFAVFPLGSQFPLALQA